MFESSVECLVYSVDLTLDLIRPRVLKKSMEFLPNEIRRPILDFLTNREFVVDINKVKSTYKQITIGCVQGSVLGPCLFSLYCRDHEKVIRANNADLITYAYDTYVVVRGTTDKK